MSAPTEETTTNDAAPLKHRRLDTHLQAAGAEYLVLGMLLVEGIQAFKPDGHQPSWDLLAVSTNAQRQCRIQVKSRWATDFDAFVVRGTPLDCDFYALVALNRGSASKKAVPKRPPEIYVVSAEVAHGVVREHQTFSKVFLADLPGGKQKYLDNWSDIRTFLRVQMAMTDAQADRR